MNQISVIQLLGGGGSCTSEFSVGGLRISAVTLHPGFLGWTGRRPGICFCFCCCCSLFLRVPKFEAQLRAVNTIGPTSRSFQCQLSCSLALLGVSSAQFIFAWRGFLLEASWSAGCRLFSVVQSPVVLTPWNLSCTADTSEFRLSCVHSTVSRNCVSNYRVELNSPGSRVCVVWNTHGKRRLSGEALGLECTRSWVPPH